MKTPSHSPILERFIGRRFGLLPRERHALRAALIPFLRIEQFARFLLGHPTRHSRSIGLIGVLASRRGFRLIVTGLGLAGARRRLRRRWRLGLLLLLLRRLLTGRRRLGLMLRRRLRWRRLLLPWLWRLLLVGGGVCPGLASGRGWGRGGDLGW